MSGTGKRIAALCALVAAGAVVGGGAARADDAREARSIDSATTATAKAA